MENDDWPKDDDDGLWLGKHDSITFVDTHENGR